MNRYILFGLTILLGFSVAAYYGWAERPVKASEASPVMLREDFRSDYVLMVAEAYQNGEDAERAISALSLFAMQGEPFNPYASVSDALTFGTLNNFSVEDLALMQSLQLVLLEFDPTFGGTPTP